MAQREYQRIVCSTFRRKKTDSALNDAIDAVSRLVWHPSLRRDRSERRTEKWALHAGFDVACAALGLVFLAPLFAAIAAAIKLADGGPVFYRHARVGKGFRKIRVLKFRSMIPNPVDRSPLTAPGDARVTRVGSFLRNYKLDELPQLLNVLKGEMRLVGVRPQHERYVEMFRDAYRELLRTPPGITSLASLSFRNETELFHEGSVEDQYITKILPVKLEMSLEYARTRTFRSDLEIIIRTVLGRRAPAAAWRDAKIDPALHSQAEYFSRDS